ncbi:type II secretion system pilot lipoprotein GspS [Pantoea sp. 1.19]|uniref:type II secretion system pilot lipoprotein GspS n=1 Tax=Pantoea sp. 1.19 TaxID=1925589 RepID=UPI000948AE81|nr:type II secretion system pilot lipoprotein GspS [Pantoea sp. 1.19]
MNVKPGRLACGILAAWILTGCQHPSRSLPPPSQQAAQLSALVAAANWLRDRCQRQDIAAEEPLIEHALQQARQRDWTITPLLEQQVREQSQRRYQALSAERGTTAEKCAALNPAAAPFLRTLSAG